METHEPTEFGLKVQILPGVLNGMEYKILNEVTEVFFHELQKKYPKLHFWKLELQAPGYAIRCGISYEGPALFMLKMTSGGVLFDIQNLPSLPHYSDKMATGMLRRLLSIEYENPRMVDIILDFTDRFLRDAGVI